MSEKCLQMIGKIIVSVEGACKGSEELRFNFRDGTTGKLYHIQECCEAVEIEDIVGDFSDFIGQPLTMIEERRSNRCVNDRQCDEWVFYEFQCPKGFVTVRWLGNNGYYSDEVDFVLFNKEGEVK